MRNLRRELDGVEFFTDEKDKVEAKKIKGKLERGKKYLVRLYFKHKKIERSYQNV